MGDFFFNTIYFKIIFKFVQNCFYVLSWRLETDSSGVTTGTITQDGKTRKMRDDDIATYSKKAEEQNEERTKQWEERTKQWEERMKQHEARMQKMDDDLDAKLENNHKRHAKRRDD